MTDISAGQFTLDSSLDLAADGYTAPVVGSATYLAANDADVVTYTVGLKDPATGTAYTVGHLVGGIDDYELHIQGDRITGSIRGRDNMAELLDRRYQMRYLRAQPTALEKIAMDGKIFAGLADPTLYTVGKFTASEIARQVVASCGLTLAWECRDYTLHEGFDASGRPIDILHALVEPWSQVEPLKVDVFVQGSTVICRPRSLTPTADYTYAVADARIEGLTIRRKRAEIYGRVTITGEFNLRARGIGSIVPIEVEETTEDVSGVGAYGQPLTRVVRTTTYLVPPRIPIRISEQTYMYDPGTTGTPLVKDESTTNEWDPIQTTDVGVVNQPRLNYQHIVTKGIHPKDENKRWRVLAEEETFYAFGGMGIVTTDMFGNNLTGFQTMTTTRKKEVNIRLNIMEEKERVVRTWRECGNLQTEVKTDIYRPAGTTGAWSRAPESGSSISAGVPPGGPRPDRTVMIGGTAIDPREQLSVEAWVSTDVYAKDITYNNRNLTQEDIDFVLSQFVAASGLWYNEMLPTYISMPWLRKGRKLQLTGLLAEDGTPIPLGPALVAEQHLVYDESPASPSMLSTLRAIWWAA
jgi:hypothetical protein